jgi:hypothetical protein
MKRILYVIGLLSFLAPGVFAQSSFLDHLNVGVYGNFFRLSDSDIDLGGVGARVSVNIMPRIQLEAESGYNFEAAYSQGFSDYNGTVTVSNSHVRSLDGLFGPKLYTKKGPVRLFGTVKGGFINFNLATSPAVTIQTVSSAFQGINGTNTYGVFYPGGGAEAFWGPIGLRLDVGDEIFFNNGAHNNLRVSLGPTFRF